MFRLRVAVVASALTVLIAAPAALAHQGNPNYRSIIRSVTPELSGVRLDVLNFDDRLELQNTSGRTVVIAGYQGEPYARLRADGTVEVNRRSPAFYLNDERFAGVKVPSSANARATPRWQLVDRAGRFQWHDHRIHWMSRVPPKQVADADGRTKIFDWTVPLRVGDTTGAVRGTLFWQPPAESSAPVSAYVGLGAVVLLALAAIVVVRRRRRADAPVGAEVEAW
jgi:MYXO-CTERM domain-containing protein